MTPSNIESHQANYKGSLSYSNFNVKNKLKISFEARFFLDSSDDETDKGKSQADRFLFSGDNPYLIWSSSQQLKLEQKVPVRRKTRRRRIRERVSAQLAEVATSYGLVRFHPLVVTDEKLLQVVLSHVSW